MLCAAAMAVPQAALAQSGGAGDNQYQDPFGSSGKSSGSSHSTTTRHPSSSGTANGLSQSANLGSSSSTSSSTVTATAPAATGQLPNTGSDPRLIVLAGLALLLFGIGLRLRTADENF